VCTLQTAGKRKLYLRVSDDQKADIGKYTAEHGIVKAMTKFAPDFPNNALKELKHSVQMEKSLP